MNLPKPSMKWSPCLKIVTPGPSVYRRVRFAKIIMLVLLNVDVKLSLEFSCLLPVTTLRQRLLQPDFQPAGASQLHPRHKHLLMKRSLRCRVRTLCSPFPIKCCCFLMKVHKQITFFVFLNFLHQKCEHNLSKPEFNPTSIKFKIQLVAV